jgi:hypothetical protein
MHRDPISPGFARIVPVLWVLNILPQKNGWGCQMSWISTSHKKYEIVENA